MVRARFTTEAWRDLEEILRYIGARNPNAASRLTEGLENFQKVYKPLADAWRVYDNSGPSHRLLESNS